MKRAAVYARVSTALQDAEMQVSEALAYATKEGYKVAWQGTDQCSGARFSRPQRDALLKLCEQGKIDVVLVWRLDRFSRSVSDLVQTFSRLQSWGVDFVSLHEHLDTTTASGKLLFHIAGAFAEFERSLISERQKASVQARRGKPGRRFGRKPLPPGKRVAARHLVGLGWTYRAVHDELGIAVGTVATYAGGACSLDVVDPDRITVLVVGGILDRADAYIMEKAMAPRTPSQATLEEELFEARRRPGR